jgi:hypothetical protein
MNSTALDEDKARSVPSSARPCSRFGFERRYMSNETCSMDKIMSTNAISASHQTSLAALFGAAKGSPRHGDGNDRASFGDRQEQGINVLASLLQALIQAAGTQPKAATTSGATTASGAITASATATTATTASTSSTTSGSSLVHDLQAFLHDLIHALRQEGRSHRHDDDDAKPPVPATPVSSGSSTSTATTSTPAAAGPTVAPGTTTAANTGVAAYGQNGTISVLQALLKDLANSQEVSNTGSSSSLSSNTLSKLNSAFQRLIGDLNGSNASAANSAIGGANSGTSGGPAAGSAQSTAALQSFLTNFVQDLQNNGANSPSPLGSSVNTTA